MGSVNGYQGAESWSRIRHLNPFRRIHNTNVDLDSMMFTFIDIKCNEEKHALLKADKQSNPFNPNGKRTAIYFKMLWVSYHLRRFATTHSVKRREDNPTSDYVFQPKRFSTSYGVRSARIYFNGIRTESYPNLYRACKRFQPNVVKCWRGNPPPLSLLILPLSIQDETSKEGSAIIIYDALCSAGMLVLKKGNYELSDDYEKKWLFYTGDELTVRRLFEFQEDIFSILDKKRFTFKGTYTHAMKLCKLLPRMIPINGDLHIRFHLLDAIYRLYSGGFLQAFQTKLGWKHINGRDAPKTYQNCHQLAILVYQEADRLLRDTFLHDFYCSTDFRSQIYQIIFGNKRSKSVEGKQEFVGLFLSNRYSMWLLDQWKESTDWVRRFVCGYVVCMTYYVMYKEAERTSDSPSLEQILSWFFPLFEITGKKNSKNTNMKVMEKWYSVPPKVLHQLRINRCRRNRDIIDTDGYDSPNVALDETMEMLMPTTKKYRMNIRSSHGRGLQEN